MNDSKLDKKIEQWKSRLLDLSKRNRLLNFKTNKSTVKIDTDTQEVFNFLLNDKSLRVNAFVNIENEAKKLTQTIEVKDYSKDEIDELYQRNITKVKQKLEKQLNDIRLKGKASIDEKGVNTLYLACGFLNWTEVDYSKTVLKSPILLVPLTLYRESARDPYFMQSMDDEVILNPVLEQKLKIDFGVNLSPLEELDYESFEDIINLYEKELKIEDSWTITQESYIGLFSFNKLVMFTDFEQYENDVKENPFVQALSGIEQERDICERDNIQDIKTYDQKGSSERSFQILDADSSQQESILAAKNGVSFIMQGPPGTGKSQTITNIIAESLADGKRVLFVSEKKAALDVVKKRIDDKGLSDYCLDLHSHNSNKKAVLEELKKALEQKHSPLYAFQSYSEFDDTKQKLNQYVAALHKKIEPLNETPQKIHGKLSVLNEIPELLFELSDVQAYDTRKLNEARKSLIRLERVKSLIGREEKHLWKGAIPKEATFELESSIKANFNSLSENLKELSLIFKNAAEMVAFKGELSLIGIDHILDLNKMMSNKPDAPITWFSDKGKELLEKADEQYENYQLLFTTINKLKKELLVNYKSDILNIKYNELYNIITTEYKEDILTYVDHYDGFVEKIFLKGHEVEKAVEKVCGYFNEINKAKEEFRNLTGFQFEIFNEKEILFFEKFYDLIKDNPSPTEQWFHSEKRDEIRNIIKENRELFKAYNSEKIKLEKEFDLGILNENLDDILNRFTQEYTSFLRILKGQYKKDNNLITSYLVEKKKLQYDKTIKDIRALNSLKKLKNKIEDQKDNLSELFGLEYNGEKTDWDKVSSNIENIFSLDVFLIQGNKQDLFKPFILKMETQSVIIFRDLIHKFRSLYQEINNELLFLRKEFMPKLWNIDENTDLYKFIDEKQKINDFISGLLNAKNKVNSLSLTEQNITFNNINELFKVLNNIERISEKIDGETENLSLLYGELFKGYDTDWFAVKEAIDWMSKVKESYEEWFPEAFVDVINSKDKLSGFSAICSQLEMKEELLEHGVKFYQSIFPYDEKIFNGQSFYYADLSQVCLVLDRLSESTFKLQEWITFQEALNRVYELGLEDFVRKIIENDKLNSEFEIVFLKRFYQLWLDNAYRLRPSLKQFRIDQHERLLEEFRYDDLSHIDINSSRLHEILTERKESYLENYAYKSSEVAVLRREIQKQKRHKPIRKLFSTIPDLLMSLKPCMMMSPLSVSQFIDPSILKFDVVIFDEASQIRPEDAIAAIMRGKQLIIAGDNKQLPPTSFFSQQVEVDEEFIDEEDEDIYENFESILDECLLFMPQMSLKWHYRSKQESLIAFSNKEIYNNELYTFPNSLQREHDGISHVYVKDGVYDRGGSGRNLKEAEKVAELVFEHINRSKDRSLGIIAFSEKQQGAIQDKIDELRKQYPEHDDFFNENRFESFFVKNLENVQGDERDTIIISIGYGRDLQGRMYYNFGPLNKDGGERRLNVAVSRAKKEIKVVSSILDIDLDDTKLTKRGPKLLKAYLAYAKSGGEFSYNTGIENDGEVDSPFEQDVYDTLRNKGLELRKQVGCSGYRIDLAVVDPKQPGKYILGIECDGATYHSSKTARDRDRLRQNVLESLGWEIERIWSQDWVKRKKVISDLIVDKVQKKLILSS
ncbi:DUF4011 domain-containing protein [Domibacillus mangrovi]|uniref:RAP domain-containing protein n=1 Tax=Domibacillus mangrovi TaxID=1714354 RepID=A0A1Q5P376_9BACI|nr:DUF4011 domain-containing protein [Domibacillus mangrovi]OKL36697.1 hypothetical protein BLL40_08135 [Domibacillus mangrovi]